MKPLDGLGGLVRRLRALLRTRRAVDAPGHAHGLPPALIALVLVSFLGLAAGVVIVAVSYVDTQRRLAQLEEYIVDRGEQRDRERDELQQRIDRALCDVLDQLPPDPNTDRLRVRYDCGPGLGLNPGVIP